MLEVLERAGETPQSSLMDRARIPAGSIAAVCRRLETDGKIVGRLVPSIAGGAPRKVWRLPTQPEKAAYTRGGRNLGNSGYRHRAQKKAAEREAAERAEAGEAGTLRERILTTLKEAGDEGLTMAQIPAAVPGAEKLGDVENKVRELWDRGELGRRRDGTFVVASTRSWHVGEQLGEAA